ncbi:site-specific integrase [Streptomyces sp. NPDC005077]|uniref:site-specific integrase n=1 Tax=Streptomyces sp. NPDC005077 TaxID=3154292 RepID=UPI00339EB613
MMIEPVILSPAPKTQRESARAQFPARPVSPDWNATRKGREDIWELVTHPAFVLANRATQAKRIRGLTRMLDWLEGQPGATWQERWQASGAQSIGADWRQAPMAWLNGQGRRSQWLPAELSGALKVLICADVLRPSLNWMVSVAAIKSTLAHELAQYRDREGFTRLRAHCEAFSGVSAEAVRHTLHRSALIIAAKGGTLTDITVGDVLQLLDAEADTFAGPPRHVPVFYQMLHTLGLFDDHAPTRLRELRTPGQRTPDELIDRYQLSCQPVRDLLVDYLRERQPALDYNSLKDLSYYLGKRFWKDLELHHPGIESLRLPPEVTSAWRQRLLSKPKTVTTDTGQKTSVSVPRISYRQCLTTVRAFYLDLSQWAIEDPGRWAQWVAPSRITQEEIDHRKFKRRHKARMDARTRERLPVLPVLVQSVDRRRRTAEALLQAARQCRPGGTFMAAGQTLTRSHTAQNTAGKVWAESPTPTTKRRDLVHEEEYAFWAWAAVEVLRLTGVRIEELLEISHHSLVQYRLPTTGEIVPLLQIAPSKTDAERLLAVSPELADVLSTIIQRVRGTSGAVPLVPAYDWHECVWMPPAPLLFQRAFRTENRAISHGTLRKMLLGALADTGLVDPADGQPLRYTPHDFRRIFITDAIMNGMPPHIAQVIAGHRDINVTLGYKAIYPDEAIQAHLAFLARRRRLRPSEEYRVPTDAEWEEFLGHFERRKVSTGTCGRAYSTPCIHEHACLRCSMHWPDPAQRPRIAEIRDNLLARIAEAKREGWLGEVEGLNISLDGANDKLAQIDRRSPTRTTVHLGMPARPPKLTPSDPNP